MSIIAHENKKTEISVKYNFFLLQLYHATKFLNLIANWEKKRRKSESLQRCYWIFFLLWELVPLNQLNITIDNQGETQ